MSEVEKKEEETTTTTTVEKTEEKKEETSSFAPAAEIKEYAADVEPNVEYEATLKRDVVEVKTNEENEDTLFEIRAKLYRFDTDPSPQWKERGTGNVRFLEDKDSKRIRVVMRRDKTLKVCLNHHISPALSLGEMTGSDKSWVWKCPKDFSDEEKPEGVEELFAIRFATPENAGLFKTEFQKCQAKNEAIEKKTE
ncbi:Ran binding protein 1 domain-containing protein [Dictyostelium discoideum AX4]|uniref:Ran-specific GTPase-activating protein homolog n=1 Tax=Dictyostelium discoideum TaxID=44689 RepID=RANG_DICDI|nr:Ran binding protein 1 domain-containing protein [Dictyostelium discoideum AX4]Q54KD9.1 RecName: Full=Ran-specific GTPase-activating protein homolog; AltName: Full=Ran-binding protein 1; Short=RanBP1 [Dictyostelium discoideum]EAL63763.1 Ran binding protein 1 domain-containing protein [Dictyostelium discoideum AX4]|eukprot:XP_637284.1 Ran binding protein 1 domain-containing protein [Dictyostelium discoideum AX4]